MYDFVIIQNYNCSRIRHNDICFIIRKFCSILKGQYQNVNETPYSMETRECIASYDKIIQEAHLSLYHSPHIIGHETFEYIFFTLDAKKNSQSENSIQYYSFRIVCFFSRGTKLALRDFMTVRPNWVFHG